MWLPGGDWLDPAAGNGAIVRAVSRMRTTPPRWTAVELRHECRPALLELADAPDVHVGIDFCAGDLAGTEFDVVITNPPFSLAREFIEHALPLAPWVVMLLRLDFLGSAQRSAFFRGEMPDVYVLPNRPSFTGNGTDSTEYAWCVWSPERGRRAGRIEVLAETPIADRSAKKKPAAAAAEPNGDTP